jgi:hypothetical protein
VQVATCAGQFSLTLIDLGRHVHHRKQILGGGQATLDLRLDVGQPAQCRQHGAHRGQNGKKHTRRNVLQHARPGPQKHQHRHRERTHQLDGGAGRGIGRGYLQVEPAGTTGDLVETLRLLCSITPNMKTTMATSVTATLAASEAAEATCSLV